jgi:hypothetical protein
MRCAIARRIVARHLDEFGKQLAFGGKTRVDKAIDERRYGIGHDAFGVK